MTMAAIPQVDRDPTLDAADAAIEEKENAQKARPYLGMSSIGNECSRALWYGFRWSTPSHFDAVTLKRFDDGHRSEAIQIERLRAVPGITLYITDPRHQDGQIACKDIGGHFRGHLDGIITGLLQAPATTHCWEHKCTNEKKQAALVKLKAEHGEKQSFALWDTTYYAQGMLYCHYQGLERHYLTVASPGSRTCVSCRTNADPATAEKLIAKAHRIITANEPMARISENPGWHSCKWCDHHAVCHLGAVPAVSCRTCLQSTPEIYGEDGRWTCALFNCDISTETQRSGCECPRHAFIPSLLLPWKPVDADTTLGWVEYVTSDGRTVRNGPTGYSSSDIAAAPGAVGDVVFGKVREVFEAGVVG